MAARAKRKTGARARPNRSSRTAARRAAPKRGHRTQARSSFSIGAIAKKLGDAAKEMVQAATQQRPADDGTQLLEHDHREVEGMLERFEQADDAATKAELADKICLALTVHTEIEEKLLYPQARRQIDDADLLDEAEVEHASAKQMIAELQGMTPRDRLFDAKVTVRGEYVKHHVKDEETELFPKVRDSGMDLAKLGEELMQQKMSLLKKASRKG